MEKCTLSIYARFFGSTGRGKPFAVFHGIPWHAAESLKLDHRGFLESLAETATGYPAHDFMLEFVVTGKL